jgi:C-terminal peptidase prc
VTARRTLAALLAVGVCACGGDGGGNDDAGSAPSGSACSTLGQVSFVRDTLRDIYLWYRELPDPDPAGFQSPEAYLEAVRFKPIDHSYSYITDKAASDAFFSESQFVGIGLGTARTGEEELRVQEVYEGSPAAEAGLRRGDYVITINGRSVADLLRTGDLATIFGPSQPGVVVALSWHTARDSRVREAQVTKRAVTIPTVSTTQIYELRRGARVGYVFFRNFVQPSSAALDTAFRTLREGGASELVLDLRYNGGGLLSVAQHLASLIGGSATEGELFLQLVHNDKNQSRNSTLAFERAAQAIGVGRLVVITTRGSASASEAVVNGLRPFMNVTLVGDTTYGKPVGQYGFDFCEKTLFPVAFQGRNALGQGDFFDGIPADCGAGDDLEHLIGDPAEASLQGALQFLQDGRCAAASDAAAAQNARRFERFGRRPLLRDAWRELIGAD